MNALLSLIVCVAMLLGAGAMPAVPEEQTVLTVRNLYVTSGEETKELTPEVNLTCALGTSFADALLTLPAESTPTKIALRLTPDGAAFLPDGERVFTISNAILRNKLKLSEDQQKMTVAVEPFLAGAAETLSTGVIPEDFSAQLFDALAKAASITPADTQIPIGDQTFDGKSFEANISFTTLLTAFDALAEGEDATAVLMKNCLKNCVKADGVPCEKFVDLAPADTSDAAPVKYTQARVNDVSYDRVSVESGNGAAGTGALIFESVTVENVGTSAVLTLNLTEDKTSFAYSGKLDLQGTIAAPKTISFTEDMINSNTADPEAGVTDKRHLELNAACAEQLWNVAVNSTYSHGIGEETPEEKDLSLGYTESVDENGVVTGLFDLTMLSGEKETGFGFEVEKSRVPFEDALADCAVMALTDATDDVTAMVYKLDLDALNADIRAFFNDSELTAAAQMLGFDLNAVPLFGEAVEPEATPEPSPSASVEPTTTPEATAAPTAEPTAEPAAEPEVTEAPVEEPVVELEPIEEPVEEPTDKLPEGDFGL